MKKMVITAALFLAVVFVYAQEEQRRLRFFYEDPEVIRLLEEYNARLWYRTYECPWHELLFARAPFEAFQKLFALGVDTEQEGIQRDRPLMEAISSRRDDVVEFLLSHGADAHRANRQGGTPLVRAAAFGNPRIIELLINAGASTDVTRALLAVFTRGGNPYHAEKTRILLENGADANAVTSNGWTPLLMAARNDLACSEATRLLISAGANIHALSPEGQSALMLVVMNASNAHNLVEITLLLEAGVDARLRDNTGRTALEWFDMNQRINRHPIRRELWERTM